MNEDTDALPKLEYTGNYKITGESKGKYGRRYDEGSCRWNCKRNNWEMDNIEAEYPSLGVILTGWEFELGTRTCSPEI